MRIRRFEAPDSKTALAMVKAELGDEAVILANRTVPVDGGLARKYGRTRVEVVAAMDYDLYSMAGIGDGSAAPPASAVQGAASGKSHAAVGRDDFVDRRGQRTAAEMVPIGARRGAETSNASPKGPVFNAGWQPEPLTAKPKPESRATVGSKAKARQSSEVPTASSRKNTRDRPPAEEVARWREQLIGRIRYDSILEMKSGARRVVALVGATGVGKTTSVAKIAAHARLHKGLKVCLVSMDCYRIGATDQLRTYARIMRIPCEVVLKQSDLPKVIAKHSDCDLIIIDTAGKSPYDDGHVDELTRWFAGVSRVEPYLTISATTKKEDLKAVFEKYRDMHVQGLIVTKLDETRAYATLCQQLAAGEIPVSCLCIGQRVPEDLVPAGEDAGGLLFRHGWQAFLGRCAGTGSGGKALASAASNGNSRRTFSDFAGMG